MKNNLKQIRTINKCSQKKLADALGVSKAMISMWENNPNEKIPDSRVKQICDYLNIDEVTLLFEVELDTRILEKEVLEREMELLAEQYENNYESIIKERIQEQSEKDLLKQEIDDELITIVNDSVKLRQIKRFSQILNDFQVESLLNDEAGVNGTRNLMNSFISLLESKDTEKLKFLYSVTEYLTLFNKDTGINQDSIEFSLSSNKNLLLTIDALFNEIKGKQGGM